MKDTCDFCGSKANEWIFQGGTETSLCSLDSCYTRYRWGRWEPKLLPWMDPSPIQRLGGRLMCWLLEPVWRVIPTRWLIDAGGWRESVAVWAYGNAYFWAGRAEGMN